MPAAPDSVQPAVGLPQRCGLSSPSPRPASVPRTNLIEVDHRHIQLGLRFRSLIGRLQRLDLVTFVARLAGNRSALTLGYVDIED